MTAEGEVHIREWLKATCEYHTLTRWAVYWHPLVLKSKFVYTTFSKYKFNWIENIPTSLSHEKSAKV